MGSTYILIADYDQLHSFVKLLHRKTEELFNLHFYTQRKVEALKQEWFGEGAEDFYAIMEEHLLPALVKVIEAMTATQDRIRQVMRTIDRADGETRIYFSTDALTSDVFASRLFLETLAPAAKQAGLVSASSAAGSPVSATAAAADKNAPANQRKAKAQPESARAHSPQQPPAKPPGKARSVRSGEMSGLSGLGESLKGRPASSALVGGAGGAGPQGLPVAASDGSGGGSPGGMPRAGNAAPQGDGSSSTPASESGLAGGAAAAALAAALAAAAQIVRPEKPEDEPPK